MRLPRQGGCITLVCRRLSLGVGLLVIATIASLLARFHWVFDLATHFKFHYACGALSCLATGIFFRQKVVMILSLCVLIINGLPVFAICLPTMATQSRNPSNASDVRIVCANVLTSNPDRVETAKYLASFEPDIIVCIESDFAWFQELSLLNFPYQKHETFTGNFGITLLSKIELDNVRIEWIGTKRGKVPAIAADVLTVHPFEIIGAHTFPPIGRTRSGMRNEQLQNLAELAVTSELPTIVMGDFNITPYSPYFSDLLRDGKLSDSRQGIGYQATWPNNLGWVGIPIDHCLLQDGIRAKQRTVGKSFGADHLPIILDLEIYD